MAHLVNLGNILLLAFGFGFVIFWHELGHFLAAKWADVKVEQFAVGFGQAMLSWRKGLGFRWGSSNEEYQRLLRQHLSKDQPEGSDATPTEAQLSYAAAALSISETEYRLNWIPLGGYVKMLGQDDLKPGQTVTDPRSYNNKTISQRMVIVSAGVIMNVILAAIGFVYIYTVGIQRVHPTAGLILPGSPAQHAYKTANGLPNGPQIPMPLRVGDTVLALNGREVLDFDKLHLYTALSIPGETVPIDVQHADGSKDRLWVTPQKDSATAEFPSIGMGPSRSLKGPPAEVVKALAGQQPSPEESIFKTGDVITAVEGEAVRPDQYAVLDKHLQQAAGRPIKVTIANADGTPRTAELAPHFAFRFGDDKVNFAGMQMLNQVDTVSNDSPLTGKLQPGDIIVNIADTSASGGQWPYPTFDKMVEEFNSAGEKKITLELTVLRNGETKQISGVPSYKNPSGKWGFGISIMPADGYPTIAADLVKGSPGDIAGVRGGSTIVSINNQPVQNWFDVKNILASAKPGEPIKLVGMFEKVPTPYTLPALNKEQIDDIASNSLVSYAVDGLAADDFQLKARNIWVAFGMGVNETRDAILQVYLTVRSMSHGGVSPKELSGPVGILSMGYVVASRGFTHLVWFLSIIGANLAVMNFLPIPIVDGGLFTFLIIEKLKGSPISQRTQQIAQVVGLALLLSVFVFATFQDVSRLPLLFGNH